MRRNEHARSPVGNAGYPLAGHGVPYGKHSSPSRNAAEGVPYSRGGYTLLEVILALALTVVVLGLVGVGIHVHLAVAAKSREQVEEAQLARALLQRIADDLRNAVPFQPPPSSSDSGVTDSSGTSSLASSSGTSSLTDPHGAAFRRDFWHGPSDPDRDGAAAAGNPRVAADGAQRYQSARPEKRYSRRVLHARGAEQRRYVEGELLGEFTQRPVSPRAGSGRVRLCLAKRRIRRTRSGEGAAGAGSGRLQARLLRRIGRRSERHAAAVRAAARPATEVAAAAHRPPTRQRATARPTTTSNGIRRKRACCRWP